MVTDNADMQAAVTDGNTDEVLQMQSDIQGLQSAEQQAQSNINIY